MSAGTDGGGATVVRDAGWIVAWDGARHVYRRGGDVAWEGGALAQVGGRFEGAAAREIDGRGLMVMPGLVNVHSHPSSEPIGKGFLDELGSKRLGMSSLYEFMPLFRPDEEGRRACVEVAHAEAMLSGVTTLVDLSPAWDGWIDALAASGLRGVAAPMFRSGHWRTGDGRTVEYVFEPDEGRAAMEAAMDAVDAAAAHPSGRLSGMVAPSQIDTCTPGLLAAAKAAARERGLRLQIHAAQSVVEFAEITRRHGRTPIEWLADLDLLGPSTIVGHAIFLNDYWAVHWPQGRDLDRLAETGTMVAHCPNVFQRRGFTLHTLGRYLRAGIAMGLGTDSYPHNMLEEMRAALYLSRVASRDPYDLRTGDVLDMATVGGAAILGRDDIGRLAPGARADVVLVALDHPAMMPVRDPLRSLIYAAGERAVRDVFVDGRQVVADGVVRGIDLPGALVRLEAAQRRAEEAFRGLDHAGRTHDEASPLSLPTA